MYIHYENSLETDVKSLMFLATTSTNNVYPNRTSFVCTALWRLYPGEFHLKGSEVLKHWNSGYNWLRCGKSPDSSNISVFRSISIFNWESSWNSIFYSNNWNMKSFKLKKVSQYCIFSFETKHFQKFIDLGL